MADIAFPLSTSPGRKPQESAGRLTNCFAEPRGEGLGPVWRRAPGVSIFSDTGEDTFRGGAQIDSTNMLAAFSGTIKKLTYTGALQGQPITGGTALGDLTGDGGLTAAFDGTTAQNLSASATKASTAEGYVGKTLAAPTAIYGAIVYGSDDNGYVPSANPDVTLELYGQTGDAPISSTDGTLIGTLAAFTDSADESGNPRTVLSDDTTTLYDYVWVRVTHNGSDATLAVAEVELFSPTAAIITAVDTLSGTDRVEIFKNNAATPDVVVIANAGPYVYDPGDVDLDDYPDNDIGSPTCGCVHLGWFMFGYGNGDIQASDLNSTNINTLNKARTESNPDGVNRVWSYDGLFYAAGKGSIEIWGDPINDTGFPLNRQGFNIRPGLIGADAIAGMEPEFGHPPIYVGSDHTVRWLRGFTPEKISPPDLDRLIAEVTDKSQIEAFCYVSGGHPFWQINGPTFSWVFAVNNLTWHERQSYLLSKSRLLRSCFAFDLWIVGDTVGGYLGEPDHALHTEYGAKLIAEVESLPVEDFPNRVRVARSDFDITTGVGISTGTETQTDPLVMISWSDDGGYYWSNPWHRPLGEQGETGTRVILNNTGLSGPKGRKWRLTISDEVHFGLMGGSQSAEVRLR